MIKLTYTPWKPTFADASEPSPVQELNMTMGDGVSWEEATTEFHNFLRGAGYVIPLGLEWVLESGLEYYDRDKSGSLGDRQPEWANSMSGDDDDWDEAYDQTALELCNKCGWKTMVPDDGCLNCNRREWVGLKNAYSPCKIYTSDFVAGANWAEGILKERNT